MAAESSAANANSKSTHTHRWDVPNQRSRVFGHTIERSRSRSKGKKWWDSPHEADPERMVVRGRPTTLTGSKSDSELNQNRKPFARDVDPPPGRHRETAVGDESPISRGSSSSRPSQPRRGAESPSPPPRDEKQKLKTRFETQFNEQRAYESTIPHTPTNIDVVYNSVEAKDVTIHVELELSNDFGDELEILNRLSRMGNFALAKRFFDSHLEAHVDDPDVFVQYAEMLLVQGDFKSLLLLDGRHIFWKYGPKEVESSESRINRLELNWRLIRAVALCHSQHTLSSVWESIEGPLNVAPNPLDTNSTQLKIFSLAIRLLELPGPRTVFDTLDGRDWREWTDWQGLYRKLLVEDRIWDFRDVFLALSESRRPEEVLAELVGSASPSDQMLADWNTGPLDESTSLALLDILSFTALNSKTRLGILPFAEECLRSAERIGNSILDNFPHAVHTKPFIQWVIAKALIDSSMTHFDYLLYYPGQACFRGRAKLPYYIPVRKENPEWLASNLTAVARESLQMALTSFKQMQDYRSEAQCLKDLALSTKAPGALLDDLAHLQKSKQLDKAGYLHTCLSRYLICNDESSRASLLRDLESFGWWHDPSNVIDPNAAAAKDVLQRALSQENVDGAAKSMEAALRYYDYLDANVADTIDRNIPPSSKDHFQSQPPPLLPTETWHQRRRDGKSPNDKRTTDQASKSFGSDSKRGNDGKAREDQKRDYFAPSARRDTQQTKETYQAHYSSDDEKSGERPAKRQTNDGNNRAKDTLYDSQNVERVYSRQRDLPAGTHFKSQTTSSGPHTGVRWEHRRESSTVRRRQHHDSDDSTSRRSSSSSWGGQRDREKTVQSGERQGRRSRRPNVGRSQLHSAPERTREDTDGAYNSRQTRERSDQDQQHAQVGTGDTPRPSPVSARRPFRWGEAVVEEFGDDEAIPESRHKADDQFDVSEVVEDVDASNEESEDDSADSRAEFEDAENKVDKKIAADSMESLYEL